MKVVLKVKGEKISVLYSAFELSLGFRILKVECQSVVNQWKTGKSAIGSDSNTTLQKASSFFFIIFIFSGT